MARYKRSALPNAVLPGIYRRLRQEAGYSQRQLAARLGVSENTIRRLEQGEAAPTQEILNVYGEMAEQSRRWK